MGTGEKMRAEGAGARGEKNVPIRNVGTQDVDTTAPPAKHAQGEKHAPTKLGSAQEPRGQNRTGLLPASVVSVFCESMAMMLGAGIQTDEAVHMLGDGLEDVAFAQVCAELYRALAGGARLADAMRATDAFPAHAVEMVAVGECSGRLENVLVNLASYYDEEARLFDKIRSAVGYPAALLCVMSVILAVTVGVILPVFLDVYRGLAGSLTGGSAGAVGFAVTLGWVALALTLLLTACALGGFAASRTPRGQAALVRLFERLPFTRRAMYQLALSRFTSALAAYTASGLDTDAAMRDALATVNHPQLRDRLEQAHAAMTDLTQGRSLAQAIAENDVFEPVYARMLTVGTRTGRIDQVLSGLGDTFFDDAITQIDRVVDSTEPALAAFLTVAVGATLISVMVPLIGMMGAIG